MNRYDISCFRVFSFKQPVAKKKPHADNSHDAQLVAVAWTNGRAIHGVEERSWSSAQGHSATSLDK